jgi:hypothetical protein
MLSLLPWLFLVPNKSQLQECIFHTSKATGYIQRPRYLFASNDEVGHDETMDMAALPSFRSCLESVGLTGDSCETILDQLFQVKLLDDRTSSCQTLVLLAMDFQERPEAFASMLISDFGLSPLVSHRVRSAVMAQIKGTSRERQIPAVLLNGAEEQVNSLTTTSPTLRNTPINDEEIKLLLAQEGNPKSVKRPRFKSVVIDQKAKQRRGRDFKETDNHEYGLPVDCESIFPTVASELKSFYTFMTIPTTSSQEPTIRPATATVYMRHAKLFLGWYRTTHKITDDGGLSIYTTIPNKEKKSASAVLDFILWLRSSRQISASYEASLLRGLTKMLKFRFSQESHSDPSYGDKAFDDIPLIREIRMMHRDASKRQKVAPRSSDERQKWLSWPEYLKVVQKLGAEVSSMIEEYQKDGKHGVQGGSSTQERRIATSYQKYLVLAIFASVPDRQRTLRELEVGTSFRKDEDSGCWCIKHSSDDYKTGKAYGERPPLQLAQDLTPWVDEFLERWRPHLSPISNKLFAQSRTGKPLTQDSVYQIVSRSCYQIAGKRTNPHLLRDMLVTHVRQSSASEKELEALALYMGHSIQMQRTSYDRRTLSQKVAPAVQLMQSIYDGLTLVDGG